MKKSTCSINAHIPLITSLPYLYVSENPHIYSWFASIFIHWWSKANGNWILDVLGDADFSAGKVNIVCILWFLISVLLMNN